MNRLVLAAVLLLLSTPLALAGEKKPQGRSGSLEERIRRIEQRLEDLFQLALKLSAREDAEPGGAPEAGELARLRKECGDLRRENDALREKIDELEREAAVRRQSPEATPPPPPPLPVAPQFEQVPMPDGKITRADVGQGYAYIDLGSKDGVRTGQRFKVYTVLKGGLRKEKGKIRALRVEKDFSQCTILSMADETDPIVMGDYLWSKFFVKGRRLDFAFIGRFSGEHVQYTRERLAKILCDAGHLVSDSVTADTDFVVIGESHSSDPQFRLVQDFRIEKILPGELLEWFGFQEKSGR